MHAADDIALRKIEREGCITPCSNVPSSGSAPAWYRYCLECSQLACQDHAVIFCFNLEIYAVR